jgi:hypothetical protein
LHCGTPAHGHGGMPQERPGLRARYPYPSVASPAWTAGGVVASAESLTRFSDALFRGRLLGATARRRVVTFAR